MSRLRREVGFWPSLGRMRIGRLLGSPEFLGALFLGGGGGYWFLDHSTLTGRINVAGDMLVLLGPLAGIVFAGFALIVSLISPDYLRWLNTAPDGARAFLAPFIVAIGVLIGALLGAIGYRAIASEIDPSIEEKLFVALCFIALFGALDVVALARNIFAHGITRGRTLEVEKLGSRRKGRSADESG